nr:unnamed protein product [Spirometra erinaceieuropaei]
MEQSCMLEVLLHMTLLHSLRVLFSNAYVWGNFIHSISGANYRLVYHGIHATPGNSLVSVLTYWNMATAVGKKY